MLEKAILIALITLAIVVAFGNIGQRIELTLQEIHQGHAETVVVVQKKDNPFFSF